MAVRPRMDFIEPFILLCLAYQLVAQDDDYPSAQVSASWMNNNLSAVDIAFAGDTSMRIILSKQIYKMSSFACGFASNQKNESFFAIGAVTKYVSDYEQHISAYPEILWLANRNKPVQENATLQLLPEGDLILRDADGSLVWSTNTSNMSVVGMRIMETGNLVLYDDNNNTVWQSFDRPTHTLLPGQKLMAGQKLVAPASTADWREGSYYLSVTSQGFFAFYQSGNSVPQMYFKFSVYETKQSDEPSYIKFVNGTLALYISSAEPSEPDVVLSRPFVNSAEAYMRFDFDGHFRRYDDNDPVDLLADVLHESNYPMVCGKYGIWTNGKCSCPGGFAQDDVSLTQQFGCTEINPTTCENMQSQSLMTVQDIYYFNYVDSDAAYLKDIEMESCKEECLRNCSCKAALFRYYYNTSHGNCFLPSPVLSLIGSGHEAEAYRSHAFIKISTELERGSSATSSGTGTSTRVIAGLTIATFFFVVLIVGFCIVCIRNKRDAEGGLEDYLDQLSGMPMRFSYAELKLATGDFQKKLGEGGFGSVFEGTLASGGKIAVKRLDAVGQGEKEFAAEVKTIGSIHHVNLVRLIGFCAENLHRLLVYEFMCNGSLDKWIFQRMPLQITLDWQTRKTIVLDIAKGLAYLHEECRQRIVHLDIKPQNILLDANLHAKISDFGLSKLIDKDQSQVVTTLRGTPGYLAPEWFNSIITEKVDVYSFGIVVLEVACGRRNLDRSQPEECMHLLTLLMKKAEDNLLIDMVDEYNEDMQLHKSEAVEMMKVGLWCLQRDFAERPSMSMVVKVLEGTMDIEASMAALSKQAALPLSSTDTTSELLPSILSGPR